MPCLDKPLSPIHKPRHGNLKLFRVKSKEQFKYQISRPFLDTAKYAAKKREVLASREPLARGVDASLDG